MGGMGELVLELGVMLRGWRGWQGWALLRHEQRREELVVAHGTGRLVLVLGRGGRRHLVARRRDSRLLVLHGTHITRWPLVRVAQEVATCVTIVFLPRGCVVSDPDH